MECIVCYSKISFKSKRFLQIKDFYIETFEKLHKTSRFVIPAKAGIKYYQILLGFPPPRE
jgi:hypothetical protein